MGSRARTSHRPYSGRASPEDSAEHSRGDGLSSPCSSGCLVHQNMRSLQQSSAPRTTHARISSPATTEDSAEHSRGDGLSSPCSSGCLVHQNMRSLQKSSALLRTPPSGAKIVSSATMKGGRVLPKDPLSLSPH